MNNQLPCRCHGLCHKETLPNTHRCTMDEQIDKYLPRPQLKKYFYDPVKNTVSLAEGEIEGNLITLVNVEEMLSILDFLPRLWKEGHKTVEQDGRWWLFDSNGESIISGDTFRQLCVNILLTSL